MLGAVVWGVVEAVGPGTQSLHEGDHVILSWAPTCGRCHFERMRLRGLTGARDEFHLAAIAQNLKTLANHLWRPPPSKPA